jgi:hypothetical protein
LPKGPRKAPLNQPRFSACGSFLAAEIRFQQPAKKPNRDFARRQVTHTFDNSEASQEESAF